MKILVVGDSCTDVFIYGAIERICPEAPVPVINPNRKTENGGMCKNVVANLEALNVQVICVTNENEVIKTRFVDERSNQLVLRVDENDSCDPISVEQLSKIIEVDYDAVIISDYCKGFLNEKAIEFICKNKDNVFIDTKKKLGDWIEDVTFIKINELEHKKNFEFIPNYPELEDRLIITQGSKGCVYMGEVFPVDEVPVKDVSGAGDTFISALVVKYLETKDIKEAIVFAQECTTKVVQKFGVATI
tara:strand:+ start:1785 stop:2522 length:738 start_codon:yes stop_codon:yes gene_type:complete